MSNFIKLISKQYSKASIWGKILVFTCLLVLLVVMFKGFKSGQPLAEAFTQSDQFVVKTGADIYDSFYANIYDYLVFNNVKDQYEITEIVNKTKPSSQSIVLDVGCGTGHHVAEMNSKGYKTVGVDISTDMITKAKEFYPQYDFMQGDIMNAVEFDPSSFTHILCLYFTLYYVENKRRFFENCMNWLMPGGYLVVHLVDRHQFDPILPPGNPLYLVSPQRYAKDRITTTKVKFTDFSYSADFKLDQDKNQAKFVEKFKNDKDGKVRKNEHTLYMEDMQEIVNMAKNAGFILESTVDLVQCQYEYQYLYIFVKPN